MALLAALAAAILLAAFLMGRESARRAAQAQAAPMPSQAQTAQATSSQPTEPSQATALGPSPTSFEMPPPAPGPAQAISMPATTSSEPPAPIAQAAQATPAATDKVRDDVARYFREVEAIQSQAKASGDPEAFARTLLEQAVKGDASGFDGLTAANRKVFDALRGVQVPEPCREHHRLTVGLLEESIAMLDRVKSQLQGGDVAPLAALPAQGHELEREAREVDALAADIKRRFGL